MNAYTVRAGALILAAAALFALPGTASHAAGPVICMTDEGQGRKVPCDSAFKKANPNWDSSFSCFTDEGQGRYVPCDSAYKAKAAEQQKEQQK